MVSRVRSILETFRSGRGGSTNATKAGKDYRRKREPKKGGMSDFSVHVEGPNNGSFENAHSRPGVDVGGSEVKEGIPGGVNNRERKYP